MKTDLYNQEGKVIGEAVLPKSVFEVALNTDLVHQIMTSQLSNQRQGSAHTKTRGEVRGGGKKPWAQKGTGRARVGSSRSPIWRGGGITHGPRNDKEYTREVPKKMRKKALCMVLSEKAKNNFLVVIDSLESKNPKTKLMAKTFKSLPCNNHSTLVSLAGNNKNVYLSARNINKVSVDETRNLNIIQLLNNQYLVITQEGILAIEKMLAK